MRGSARSSQRRPSGVREIYAFVPIQRATPTSCEVGAALFSAQENKARVLVSLCAAKYAVSPQFWATRKANRSMETNFSTLGLPVAMLLSGILTTAEPTVLPSEPKQLVVI